MAGKGTKNDWVVFSTRIPKELDRRLNNMTESDRTTESKQSITTQALMEYIWKTERAFGIPFPDCPSSPESEELE